MFGTWDGVFVTCVVHLFGVISFLRLGWLVGNEGILLSSLIVLSCLLFTTISLLAAIGIMERCAAAAAATTGTCETIGSTQLNQNFDSEYPSKVASARANIHVLISTVLGSRIGGAISLIYWFGQAVSCALHITGFSETFVQLMASFIEHRLWLASSSSYSRPSINNNQNLQLSSQQQLFNYSNDTTWDIKFAQTLANIMWIEIDTTINSGSYNSDNTMAIASTSTITSNSSGFVGNRSNILNRFHSPTPPPKLNITPITYHLVSGAAILMLFVFNILDLKCLFRLQSILFASLVAAMLDFAGGLFVHHPDYGTIMVL